MTTLISVHGAGGGEHGRRCDARCHHAQKPVCACVCEGRYHGCNKSGDTGQDPRSIEDAELQREGVDPRLVPPEVKARVSEAVIGRMTGQQVKVKFEAGRYTVEEAAGLAAFTRRFESQIPGAIDSPLPTKEGKEP